MPTNRPFLANFFAAFRAHSAIQKASSSPTGVASTTALTSAQSAHSTSSSTTVLTNTNTNSISGPTPSGSRSMATKASPMQIGATTAAVHAVGQLQSRRARQVSTSPLSTSPGNPNYLTTLMGATPTPRRRSSSSSGEGAFRDVLGAEKWYIGGPGPGGEERFYRLGMVRRHRSIDRLSLDRLSM